MPTEYFNTSMNSPLPGDDLFTRVIAPVLDDARAIIEELGIRTSKIYLVLDEWSGPRKREGYLMRRILDIISPAPKIVMHNVRLVAGEQGLHRDGDISLHKVTRVFTRHQLEGKTDFGQDFDPKFDFSYAIQSKDSTTAEFYSIASRPQLRGTEWRLHLRPINRHSPLAP